MTMPHYGFCTIIQRDAPVPAVLCEEMVTPLTLVAASLGLTNPPGLVRGLLADWDYWCAAVESADLTGRHAIPAELTDFVPPITDPPTVYGAGANYYDHLAEMGGVVSNKAELSPFHFLVAPSAMTGHRGQVRRPAGCDHLDWEIELALVVGQRVIDVDAAEALDYVAGYTVANDISDREYVQRPNPALGIDWFRHKSFATMLPVGPAIVPARQIHDPQNLALRLLVNGDIRQDSNTKNMIFSAAEQIAALSKVTPLLPGDLLLTGTPAGTAVAHQRYLHPGDVMSAEIDLIGRLENTVTSTGAS